MSRLQILRYVVLNRFENLSRAVIADRHCDAGLCGGLAISAEDLTYAANYIQSRNFRAFEVISPSPCSISAAAPRLLRGIGRWAFPKA
jgi:polar amino acid transport system permease protein